MKSLQEWPEVCFGEIFDISSSKRVLESQWKKSGIPFYRAREIVKLSESGRVENELFIDEELYVDYKRKYGVPQVGDLMVSAVGTLGACYVVGSQDKFYFKDASVLQFRPRARIDSRFFWHAFKTQDLIDQINAWSGSTVGTLTISRAKGLKIKLPPLEEQKRIAAILDQADELRRNRQRALNRLNKLGQAIFLEMFGEWDRPGSNIETLQLGDHIDFLTSGSRGWAEFYSKDGGLFLRIQNVKRDELDLSDVAYVKAPHTAEAARTRLRPGDVLLSITADLGRTAVIPEGIGEAYINQHLAIIRAKRFNSRFLSAALSSPSGQRLILKRNREGVKAGLNFDDVRSVLIPDVGSEREREYCARANDVEVLKRLAIGALAKTERLFSSLQHAAFRGEL